MHRRALSHPSLKIDPALERDFARRLATEYAYLRQFAILNNDKKAIAALDELVAENDAALCEVVARSEPMPNDDPISLIEWGKRNIQS